MRGLQRDRGGLEEVARAQQNPSGPQRYWKTKIKTTTEPNFQATEAQANTPPYKQRRTEHRRTNQLSCMAGLKLNKVSVLMFGSKIGEKRATVT